MNRPIIYKTCLILLIFPGCLFLQPIQAKRELDKKASRALAGLDRVTKGKAEFEKQIKAKLDRAKQAVCGHQHDQCYRQLYDQCHTEREQCVRQALAPCDRQGPLCVRQFREQIQRWRQCLREWRQLNPSYSWELKERADKKWEQCHKIGDEYSVIKEQCEETDVQCDRAWNLCAQKWNQCWQKNMCARKFLWRSVLENRRARWRVQHCKWKEGQWSQCERKWEQCLASPLRL